MNKVVVKNARIGNLFLVRPGRTADVHESAKRLMEVGSVREVLITEGSCGFIVKAVPGAEAGPLGKEISRIVGGRSEVAVCHYQYRK